MSSLHSPLYRRAVSFSKKLLTKNLTVGAGSRQFLLPTNNLKKTAPPHSKPPCGHGAGFPACLFGDTDIGERAPTVKFFGENETALPLYWGSSGKN